MRKGHGGKTRPGVGFQAKYSAFNQIEPLERRVMLAAQIVGSAVVYPTIQAAVDAASPGATINVDPGLYPELVGINKPLTIRGAQAGVDARSSARQSTANESIVTGEAVGSFTSSAFYITASDVTIDGFTVQGNSSAGLYGAGIVIAPNEAGTHILNNVIQNNIAGLYLSNNSATDAAVIQYNVFRNNNNDGANGGRGIYTDASLTGGNLTNVTIDSNFFYDNLGGLGTTRLEAAIALESQTQNAQSNVRITNNVMEGNGKGVLAFNVTNLTISGNTITTSQDQFSAALRFEGNANNVTITNNNVYHNPGPAVRIDEKDAPFLSSEFVVNNNDFYGNSYAYGNPGDSLIVGSGAYTGTLDARNNWWGNASGPSHDGAGSGDGIFINGNQVVFSPWSTTAPISRDTPFNGLPFVTGVPIQAENFNQGGQTFAYNANGRTTNPGGLWMYRNSGIGIEPTGDVGGGYNVGFTAAGQWLDYTLNVTTPGNYRIDFRIASNQTIGGKFHVEIDGVNVTGALTSPNTGNWQVYQTLSSPAFSLTAGQHLVRLVLDSTGNNGAVGSFNWFQFTPATIAAAPTNLKVTVASGTELDLSWADADPTVTGFSILRGNSTAGPFTPLTQVSGATLAYQDTGLVPGTTYAYEVVAINAVGNSLPAGPVTAVAPTPPGAPTNLAASNVTTGGLTLSWTAPANVTGYQITRQSGADPAQLVATLPATATSYPDTGLSAGLQYQYVVSAFNLGGTGSGASLNVQTLAAAPTGLTAVSLENQITLNWTASPGATSYNIYRGTVPGAEAATPIATGIVGTSFVDPGLMSGTTYYYLVTAVDNTGESAKSAEAFAKIAQTIAPAPTGLTAGANPGQITLSWSASTNVTSYNIYRGTTPSGEAATPIATGVTTTSFPDTSVTAGVIYYYQIAAVNDAGESPRSNEAFALAPIPVPAAPSMLAVTPNGAQLTLNWTASALANSYRVYRGTSSLGEASTPLAIGVTGTTFIDPSVLAGTTYFYVVTAVNSSGESNKSNEASAKVPGGGNQVNAPTAPTNLQATNVAAHSLTLTWQAPAGADGFQITRQLGSDEPISIATLGASATSFDDSGLLADAAYQYTVVAFNSAGAGPGATISVQTSLTAPATPAGLSATADDTNLTLSWSASSGATSYNVYRGTSAGGESSTPLATGITTLSFIDIGATPGTTYFYFVTAINGAGPGSPSNEAWATVPKPQPQPQPGPNPSVIVPTVAGKVPATAIAGQKLNVNLTITLTNSAQATFAGPVHGAFYLSTSGTVDGTAIALPTTIAKTLKLKTRQKSALHLKLNSVPASVAAGTYHLLFQVTDATGAKNTVDAGTITIVPPEIDLTGFFSKVPVSETIGRKQTVMLTISNKGTATATGLLAFLLDASTSGLFDAGAVRVLSTSKKINLRPGKSATITLSFTAGTTIPNNSYLIAQLDPANSFHDVNTANNTFASSHRITVS